MEKPAPKPVKILPVIKTEKDFEKYMVSQPISSMSKLIRRFHRFPSFSAKKPPISVPAQIQRGMVLTVIQKKDNSMFGKLSHYITIFLQPLKRMFHIIFV